MTSRVLVKAVGENGDVVGWDEANPQTMVNAESLEGVLATIRRYLRPVVEGVAAGDLDLVLRRLNKAIPQVHGAPELAKAAVEAAVYDLWARTLDVPLHLLLGGKRLSRIPLAYTIQADAGEPPTSQVKKARDQGYSAFQIRLIGGKEAKDKTFLEAAAKAIPGGSPWTLMIDNGYALDVAGRVAALAGRLGASAIRSALRGSNCSGYRRLVELGGAPIAVDAFGGPDDVFQYACGQAIDVAILQPLHYGVRQTMRMAAAAEAAGIRWACGLQAESELGLAHAVQVFAALGTDFALEGAGRQYIDSPFVVEPLAFRDGAVLLPEAPGCGVTVDEDKLRAASGEPQ
jgi:muconate cycloisomerase